MARSVAVSTIMLRARRWANMERDTDFLPDSELLEYVDSAWTRLYKLYAAAWPERFQTEQSITTVAGTATYALPADHLASIGVDSSDGGRWSAMRPLQEEDRNAYQDGGQPLGWRVIGANLALYPTPGSAIALRHIYLPTAPALTSTAATIDGVLGHERLIELDVALRLKAKEEADASALFAEYMRMRAEVEEEAQMRVLRTPQTIAIIESHEPSWVDDAALRYRR
jgi:hypothetical protein